MRVLSALAPPCRSLRRPARSLRTLHDTERNLGALGETEPTGGGGNELVVTAAGTEEIAKLTMLAAEALSCLVVLETPHTSDPSLDATMILLKPIVQVGARPVPDCTSQHRADRPGIGLMPIRRHTIRQEVHGSFRRQEERLCRLYVTVLAQHGVNQIAVSIDRPREVGPPTPDRRRTPWRRLRNSSSMAGSSFVSQSRIAS